MVYTYAMRFYARFPQEFDFSEFRHSSFSGLIDASTDTLRRRREYPPFALRFCCRFLLSLLFLVTIFGQPAAGDIAATMAFVRLGMGLYRHSRPCTLFSARAASYDKTPLRKARRACTQDFSITRRSLYITIPYARRHTSQMPMRSMRVRLSP